MAIAKKINKDVQRNSYLLTINNPKEKGYDHSAIKETLIVKFTTLNFFAMADEIGESGTYHTHVYVAFSSRVRWSTVKKAFPEAHIDIAHGTPEENLNYIRKTGKWENTDKAETRVEGTYEEWGTFPTQKGRNMDMQELYEMVKEGYTNAEILEINHDYILQIDKLDKLRGEILKEKFKSTRRLDLKVTYIYGATGAGKTRQILDEHGDPNVYRVTDYRHGFDHYACQPVIAFEEYRSQLPIADMLNYCDIYPIELPSRYSNKVACYSKVYIVSNWALEQQYENVQREYPGTWKAFCRRIHEVVVYNEDKTVTRYNSVEEYLHRDEKFHGLSSEEKAGLPF